MDKDGGIDGGMRMPEWELKETSPLKTKWRKYIPAETQPTPAAVNDSFIGLGDSEEELELEPLEVLNTSLDESDDEAKDGNKGNLSDVGKQKRGKSPKNTEIERMVKEIMSRNKGSLQKNKTVKLGKSSKQGGGLPVGREFPTFLTGKLL